MENSETALAYLRKIGEYAATIQPFQQPLLEKND